MFLGTNQQPLTVLFTLSTEQVHTLTDVNEGKTVNTVTGSYVRSVELRIVFHQQLLFTSCRLIATTVCCTRSSRCIMLSVLKSLMRLTSFFYYHFLFLLHDPEKGKSHLFSSVSADSLKKYIWQNCNRKRIFHICRSRDVVFSSVKHGATRLDVK